MLVLTGGCVKIVGVTPGGSAALLALRTGGDLVGELAALDGGPRSASALTARATPARLLSAEEFTHFLRDDPAASLAVHRSVAAKLRAATEYRVSFGGVREMRLLATGYRRLVLLDRPGLENLVFKEATL
ncbi:cyclic nucleotide-binding domain-containing protein [Actinocorallia sp. API 0066]|nr:cyclic nucleotide-binding domain-containing protein [Actinocorallia sp. API 0066]